MRSQATDLTARLFKGLKSSTTTRVAALATVAMFAAIIGPPGLAVGPTQSRSNTPALPTGAAMEASAVLTSIPISFDLVHMVANLAQEHASYPIRSVGELHFPDGAIEVPWTDVAGLRGRQDGTVALTERGSTVSTPRRDGTPQLMRASISPGRLSDASGTLSSGTRSVILFDRTGSDLTGDAADLLDRLASSLGNGSERIQLRAFGGSIAERSHAARRLALRRALSVRNYLMEQGIDQERITVLAMGGATDGGPSDRVDIIYPDN